MKWNMFFLIVFLAIEIVGMFGVGYQIYKITVLDATARELKHPKFWGVFSLSGSNSSGFVMYLIGRRKYPIINMSEQNKKEITERKRSAGIGLIFLTIGAIGMVIVVMGI